MEEITIEEFLYHMQEQTIASDKAASVFCMEYESWTKASEKMKMRVQMFGPQVRYKTLVDHSYFLFRFTKRDKGDFKKMLRILQTWERDLHLYTKGDQEDFPMLFFTTVPMYYHGNYYMSCINLLMWRAYESEGCCYVELLYQNDSVGLFATDQIKESEIEAEIRREEETKAYMQEKMDEMKRYEEERRNIRMQRKK